MHVVFNFCPRPEHSTSSCWSDPVLGEMSDCAFDPKIDLLQLRMRMNVTRKDKRIELQSPFSWMFRHRLTKEFMIIIFAFVYSVTNWLYKSAKYYYNMWFVFELLLPFTSLSRKKTIFTKRAYSLYHLFSASGQFISHYYLHVAWRSENISYHSRLRNQYHLYL